MAEPGKRVPVRGMAGGEGPDNRMLRYSASYVWVFRYVCGIIVADKVVMPYRLICCERRRDERYAYK